MIVVQETRARRRERTPNARDVVRLDGRAPALVIAAAGLAASAAAHLVVTPGHFDEYVPYGVFFLVLTVAQVAVALMLLGRPRRELVALVAYGSAAVVVLWLVSRTTGLPVGPQRWAPEGFGVLDVVSSAAELVTAVACLTAASMRSTGAANGRASVGAQPGVVR